MYLELLFCRLEVLHLCLNEYESVNLPEDFVYPSLKSLKFNGNKIQNWENCIKLSKVWPYKYSVELHASKLHSLKTYALNLHHDHDHI